MKNKKVMERKTSSRELYLISCGYEKCTPAQSYGPAVRRYHTIHFILHGQGHCYINNKHYTLKENQCFYIPPDIVTLYKAEPSCPWTYIWFCFDGGCAASLLEHSHLSLSAPIGNILCIREIKQIIFDLMKHAKLTPANECYIQSGLYLLFAKLEEQANASYSDLESIDNFYISQAIAYIEKNTFINLTVQDVADYLHISRSYLFTLFKQQLDTSPQKFLTAAKISNARELLARTDVPVNNISASCGYHNPFAFSRAFKKETGMTPSEYREKYHPTDKLLDC